MSHKRLVSLPDQVFRRLDSMARFGESKHEAKRAGTAGSGIYSYETMRTYKEHCVKFVKWAKDAAAADLGRNARTLDECRPYVERWLKEREAAGLSAYTLKMERSALSKLYQERIGVKLKGTRRADITRSRGAAERDKHFSEERNAELVSFCRSTGLRRSELENLRGNQLIQREDGSFVIGVYGKGGRYREAPVIGDAAAVAAVVDRMQAAGDGLAWGKVHSAADIHGYRSDYATALYNALRRPLDVCKADNAVYWCRGDRRGFWMDKKAMLAASQALGHNRLSVVGEHYIR